MALRLPERTFVDPHEGLKDLRLKTLRTPSKPKISFSDDPLRMMRAARFASQLGFELDPEAFDAMLEMHERIEIISQERIRDELSKLMCSDDPKPGLEIHPTGLIPHLGRGDNIDFRPLNMQTACMQNALNVSGRKWSKKQQSAGRLKWGLCLLPEPRVNYMLEKGTHHL